MTEARVAVIGGSALYDMEGLQTVDEVSIDTPFGKPSDLIRVGELSGSTIAFLPRHGRGHRLTPTEVNSRANIFALKSLGVEQIISVSAVGSMREDVRPLDLLVPDQLLDRTKLRPSTFFGDGIVAHVGFADPFCTRLSAILADEAERSVSRVHRGGTYVCIEGPQFSTKAESRVYRQWGVDVIGMTALPEAKLAREAEICYATLALVTDYDVWHESAEPVTVEVVVQNLLQNITQAQRVIAGLVAHLGDDRGCECGSALKDAIITARDAMPSDATSRLSLLIGKYL